jgi:2-oxo-3-hexenedioate decarboxylase
MPDSRALAEEISSAYADKRSIPAPTTREGGLDLPTAYAVERELVRMRTAEGHRTVGLKVGFANKAMWRALKLDTLVWGHLYDDTVRPAATNDATVNVGRMFAPKVEPEIVFKIKKPLPVGAADPAAVLDAVESISLGFEIIDCVYPEWKITPIDFVAAYGLHAGLIVGAPLAVTADNVASLVEQLAAFTVMLQKNGETVAQGSGKNSLKSPALCLAELASALAKQGAPPLAPGEFVSSGTLTEAQLIVPGDTYRAIVEGIDLPVLTVRASA